MVDLQGRQLRARSRAPPASRYTIREADVDGALCVAVTGSNVFGSTTLECGAETNTILSEDPKQLAPATMQGSAYVGDTLVSTVGAWKTGSHDVQPPVWKRCEADGGSCADDHRRRRLPTYKIKDADLGKRLRVEIKADTNGAEQAAGRRSTSTRR